MPPKLIDVGKLPELNVKAPHMVYELERVFDKYDNCFDMNEVGTSTPPTVEHIKLKASILRQYIRDDALAAIWPLGSDCTKTYEELKQAIEAKFKPAYSETLLRTQFIRCMMTDGQSSRDCMQALWSAIRRTSCHQDDHLHWVLTFFV
jgi:hypothetical protein